MSSLKTAHLLGKKSQKMLKINSVQCLVGLLYLDCPLGSPIILLCAGLLSKITQNNVPSPRIPIWPTKIWQSYNCILKICAKPEKMI